MSTTMPKAQNITVNGMLSTLQTSRWDAPLPKLLTCCAANINRFLLHTLTVVTMSSSSTLRKLSSPVKNWFRRFTTITPAGLAV